MPSTDFTTEIWKAVVGYEGIYEVSNLARIRTVPRLLRTNISRRYAKAHLYRNGVKFDHPLHRLVAAAFIGPLPPFQEVNHIDGNTLNNRVENLEYVTHHENVLHAVQTGLYSHGENHQNAKLKLSQVVTIKHLLRQGKTSKQICEPLGVGRGTIDSIRQRRTWKNVEL